MLDENALEALGLTKNDSKICVALLRYGPQKASDLEKLAGIHRRNVYECLGRLENARIVSSFIRNDGQYFQAAGKDVIEDSLKRKATEIQGFLSEMKKLKAGHEIPEVHILAGERGVKMLLDDELRTGKPVYGIASSGFEKRIWDYLDKTPHKAGSGALPVSLVYIENDISNRKMAQKHAHVKIRTVPDAYKSSVALELYGDTSCIILEKLIIRIKDAEVTNRFRMFFDSLWKIGTPR